MIHVEYIYIYIYIYIYACMFVFTNMFVLTNIFVFTNLLVLTSIRGSPRHQQYMRNAAQRIVSMVSKGLAEGFAEGLRPARPELIRR